VFAGGVLHGGAHTLGWLNAAAGVGAVISAATLAVRRSARGLPLAVQVSVTILGVALICFGLSRVLWLSLLLMVFVGFGMLQTASASNTIIQSLVTEDKRARAMSYYTMAFFGMAPFGSLLAGVLAHLFGAPRTVMFTGACCVVGAVWYSTKLPAMKVAVAVEKVLVA